MTSIWPPLEQTPEEIVASIQAAIRKEGELTGCPQEIIDQYVEAAKHVRIDKKSREYKTKERRRRSFKPIEFDPEEKFYDPAPKQGYRVGNLQDAVNSLFPPEEE